MALRKSSPLSGRKVSVRYPADPPREKPSAGGMHWIGLPGPRKVQMTHIGGNGPFFSPAGVSDHARSKDADAAGCVEEA